MIIFQNRLKECRKNADLNQKDLAKLICTTNSSICDWEKGRGEPSLEQLYMLCDVLNTTADYLIGREDENGIKYKNSFNNFHNSGNINIR